MATIDDILVQCTDTKADVRNIAERVGSLVTYIGKMTDQHTEVVQRLTAIETTQNIMIANSTTYQEDCSHDRAEHEKRIGDTETAVGKLNDYKVNQWKLVVAVVGGITILIEGGGKILEKVGAWFSS